MQNETKITAVGRRKSAIAKVTIVSGCGNITINGKTMEEYSQYNPKIIKNIQLPLLTLGLDKSYDIFIQCVGGGLSGQSDAMKLAIARGLFPLVEHSNQRTLKIHGFLTRNSSCKERRKYGLKKARKAPQFSKR